VEGCGRCNSRLCRWSVWKARGGNFEPNGFDNDRLDPQGSRVCVDAVGGRCLVIVGGGRGGGVVAMVIACFYREGKSVPKFWYEIYEFLRRWWLAIDNFVILSIEKLAKGNCTPGYEWTNAGICPSGRNCVTTYNN
jgi:hypothetical protein